MYRPIINSIPCPRCGGKLEFRATIESREKGPDVHVFQCRCGHINCDIHETMSGAMAGDRRVNTGPT